MKRLRQTRIILAWYASIALTFIALFAIIKGMEGTASAAVGGILTVVMSYQVSEGWTKGKYIEKNDNPKA